MSVPATTRTRRTTTRAPPPTPISTRAPPPTPISFGSASLRSPAGAADRVLTEFLESSLRVPDLSLLLPPNPSSFEVVNLPSIVAGDATSVRRMMASASELGAFLIDGWELLRADDVRSAAAAARGVFGIGEERRRRGWSGRGDEFYWDRDMIGAEEEAVLEEALTMEGYRIFREKMQKVASRLETVAETISIILSENIRQQSQSTKIDQKHSVLCLRKYDNSRNNSDHLKGYSTKVHQNHILSLLTGDCHKLYLRSAEASSFFTLPAGFILVTIGKPFEEWSNDELKAYSGEILLESSKDQPAPIALELKFSTVLRQGPGHSTISLMDQILIMLIILLLYKLCY